MISNLKLGLRILKYGHGVKSSIICSVITLVLGLGVYVLDIATLNLDTGFPLPIGYFLMLISMFLTQLFSSVHVSNMVQSSPAKKRLQTSVPTALNLFTILCGYLISVLAGAIGLAIVPGSAEHFCHQLLYTILIMATILLYMAAVYKLFLVSSLMFFLVFFLTFQFMNDQGRLGLSWLEGNLNGSPETYWLISAAGLAFLLICGILHYLITLALYKMPLSKRAQTGALRRQM